MSDRGETVREQLKEEDKLIYDELEQKAKEAAIMCGTAITNTVERTDQGDAPDRWSELQAELDRLQVQLKEKDATLKETEGRLTWALYKIDKLEATVKRLKR